MYFYNLAKMSLTSFDGGYRIIEATCYNIGNCAEPCAGIFPHCLINVKAFSVPLYTAVSVKSAINRKGNAVDKAGSVFAEQEQQTAKKFFRFTEPAHRGTV